MPRRYSEPRYSVPRFVWWTPRRVVTLRGYADRGLSMREAAKLLDTTRPAVAMAASKLGIRFHGPGGAPKMNNHRRIGEWRKQLREMAAD